MANTLPFKCYLLTNNGQDKEIRRFTLESDVVSNFMYLKEKIRSVYPQLLRENFNISYVDEEGDKVIISSDDELVAALMYGKRSLEPFRLFVQVINGTKPETAPPTTLSPGNCQGEVHRGVTCDGCHGEVKGFRYKCLECPDFDLCGRCETAGQHPGHTLLRVTGGIPASFQAMRNLLNGGAEAPHWRRKHHGRFHHQGHHGWNAGFPSGANAEANPPTATPRCNKGANKSDSKPQCPYQFYMDQAKETASTLQANHPVYLSGLSNTIASVMEGLGLGFGSVAGSCPRAPAPQPEAKKEENAKETTQPEPQSTVPEVKKEVVIPVAAEDRASPTRPSNINPYAQLVEAIAAAQAAETANAKAAATGKPRGAIEKARSGMTSPAGMVASLPSQAIAEAVAEAAAKAPSQAVAEAVAEAAAAAVPQAIAESVAQVAAESSSPAAQVRAEATPAAGPAASMAQQQNADVGADVKPRSPRGDSGDWTIVNHGTEARGTPTPEAATPPEDAKHQSEMSPSAQAASHPDPFIAAALETMLSMGFTNEGGWLAQLLEVKGGDIGKTLDVLQSQFQRHRQPF